jgi:NAD(P)H-quinone oxidoreductase subunit 5
MLSLATWHDVSATLAALVPASFAIAALRVSRAAVFRSVTSSALLATALAIASAVVALGPAGAAAVPWPAASPLVLLDASSSLMLVLVAVLSVVVARYSRTYLAAERDRERYARALLATLASVTLLIISNNLAVVGVAWMATSLSLHRLLTFYRDRPQALVAAHKKFLLSRVADACLLAALVLLGREVGSLGVDELNRWAQGRDALPPSVHAATLLLVAGVLLKSAQLPFHGWLTQVMEAPTPVSALLHAGVVNIGGFLMIRLAPLFEHATLARGALLTVGLATAIVASLVMVTRVSIKVALAWSTIAQMGMMLVQCGLGAWHLALLHLLAHSLYKAHGFLDAGATVQSWRAAALLGPRRPPALALVAASAAALLLIGVGAVLALRQLGWIVAEPSLLPLVVVLALSLAPLLGRGLERGWRGGGAALLASAAAAGAYLTWHELFAQLAPQAAPLASGLAWWLVAAALAALFAVQTTLLARPDGALARWLQPRLFAGLYLDEWFTRMTFRLWPPRREQAATTSPSLCAPAAPRTQP